MSNNTVISVEHLSKSYRLGAISTGTFYGDLKRRWARQRGLPDPYLKIGERDHGNREGETLWALKDINFTVQQGEALGIIGRNGAGKSTLLKILSRVTAPTLGEVNVKGRIASLLEVGTGFHPELTGRENIYLNGAIMGMSRDEVTRKFDEIVEFSGVEKFINTPVKRYSSGMYVRLAFAVAAHLEPEILLVDEVLSVGDADFQKKCLGKMDAVAAEGRTVLFVSHNMSAVKDLCEHAFWIDKGRIIQTGSANSIVSAYLGEHSISQVSRQWDDLQNSPGNETVRLLYASVSADDPNESGEFTVDSALTLKFKIHNYIPDVPFHLNFLLYNKEGVCVFNSAGPRKKHRAGIVQAYCNIPANLLNNNIYKVDFYVHYVGKTGFAYKDLLTFEIYDVGRNEHNWYGEWVGVVRPKLEWKLE